MRSRIFLVTSVLALVASGQVSMPVRATHGDSHFAQGGWYGTITWSGVWDMTSTTGREVSDSSASFVLSGTDAAILGDASIDLTSYSAECPGSYGQTAGSASGLDAQMDFSVAYDGFSYSFVTPTTEGFPVTLSGIDCGGGSWSSPSTYPGLPYNDRQIVDTLENGVLEGSHDFGESIGVYSWRLAQSPSITYTASYDWDVNFGTASGRRCQGEETGQVNNACHSLLAGSAAISLNSSAGAPAITEVCLVDSYLVGFKRPTGLSVPLGVSYSPADPTGLNEIEFHVTPQPIGAAASREDFKRMLCQSGPDFLHNRSLWLTAYRAAGSATEVTTITGLSYGMRFDVYVGGCTEPISVAMPANSATKRSTAMESGTLTGSLDWC